MFIETESQAKYFEVLQRASSFLRKKRMSTFAAEWLMCERLSWSKTDLLKNYRKVMPLKEIQKFEQDINQFYGGKPVQQIVGHEWFYNRKFIVNEHTLIPRPETEEWIDQVFNVLPNRPFKVLDIGTGTGVLAITHKLERPEDEVTALDISIEGIKIAEKNAERLNADVRFLASDLFKALGEETFDVILSNPPYIGQKEINLMDESVLKHEPKIALFAEDNGLAIYKKIALDISKHLNEFYFIFLEIGYAQGESVMKIFQSVLPEAKVEIWKDFSNLDRVVIISN